MGVQKLYLLAYNGVLFGGWLVILLQIARNFAVGGTCKDVYPLIQPLLVVSQTAAVLEIFHAMVGLVRSPVMTTFMQVFSRLLVLYGALELGSPAVTESYFATQMIVAWSLSELVRYSFYFLSLIDKDSVPNLITMIRYSAFTVLYPAGITGEIVCLYNALPFIKANKPYTVELPNSLNFSYNFYYSIWFTLLVLYPHGSYTMYSYMLAQRKKTLQGLKEAKKQK